MKHNNMPIDSYEIKDAKKTFKSLIFNLKKYLVYIIIALILSIFGSVLTILGPNELTKITDAITQGLTSEIDIEYVKRISLVLFIFYLSSFIFSYLQGITMTNVTQNFTKMLRKKISKKINNLPLKYFDQNSIGDIMSRTTNDIDLISQTLNQTIGSLTSAITTFIGCTIMMFSTNFYMTITAIVASLIGFGFMIAILSKSQKYFMAQQEVLGNLNGYIEEIYSSHNVVKAYNGSKNAKKKFNEYNDKLFLSARKSQFLSGLMPSIMGFIGNFGYVAVCVVGAYLTLKGNISFGVIIAFIVYVRLFSNPLTTIAQSANSIQSLLAASERVFNFLDEDELEDESYKKAYIKKEKVKGFVDFENVVFSYGERTIIKNFNAHIKPGQKIAIVGPTGAGKTTLVNLLMRFYEINKGSIKIDGIDTKDLTRDNIHELFCMVLQDSWIFEGTIKDNIRFNQTNVKDEEIIKACKYVGLDHLIKSLPNGYDTIIGDNETLSSGEKQLLTIARGMLEKAPFLILDEATSNVDTRTEEVVAEAMDKLSKGKTSFIIAHRLSTIKNADIILVIKDGNIIEQGNHKDLMQKNGFYAELYNSQFKNE